MRYRRFELWQETLILQVYCLAVAWQVDLPLVFRRGAVSYGMPLVLLFRNYRYLQIFEDISNPFTDICNSITDICKRIADIRNSITDISNSFTDIINTTQLQISEIVLKISLIHLQISVII